MIKNNCKILFQGDSISDAYRTSGFQDLRFFNNGEDLGTGFPKMTQALIAAKFPNIDIQFFNRAVSGNTTTDLLARWNKDCIEINPDILVLLVGINDVWRKFDSSCPISTKKFSENYEGLLSKALEKNPNLKIIIIEPSYLNEPCPLTSDFRTELIDKIEAIRILAKKYGTYYIPMDGILTGLSMNTSQRKWVFDDGVHLTNCGHGVLTYEIFKILSDM